MNPLQRRLFRLQQPGMSRQPMGILASSPQLMTAAQKAMMQGQPMKAKTGASVNTGRKVTVSGQEYTITNQGVFDSRGAPVTNPNVISMIQKQNVIDAANPVSGMLRQFDVGNVDMSAALSDAAGRKPVGQSEGGRERSAKIGEAIPEASVGDVSLGNALSDFSGRRPVGQSEGGRERSAALADAPGKIASGLSQGLGTIFDLPEATGPAPSPESPMGTKNKQLVRSRAAAAMGIQDDPALRPIVEQNIDESISQSLRNRPDPALGDEFGNMAPDGSMPSEILAATTSPPSKPQTGGDETTGDKSKTNGKLLSPAAALQSVYGATTKKSDITTAFENDVTNFNEQFLTGVTENKEAVIDAQDRLVKANKVFDDALSKKRATAKEFSLEDVREEALKISGIDKTDYDENRKDAFWMGLMRAGLAIAAGESENTLTNVAKGLGFGLEGYGKDIATLNAQEREDRKELRAISMDLIKTKNDREMAVAAAENDFNYNQQRLAQASVQGADAALLQAQNREATHKMNGLQLQANLSYQLNTLKQADKKLAADTAYKNWALQISMLPDEAKQAMVIEGNGGFNPETGKFELTPQGETYYKSLVDAATKSRYSITDLDKGASAAADVGNVQGIQLSQDPATARSQALVWASQYQDAFDAAAKDPVGGEETQKRLLDRFQQAIGGGSTQLQTSFDEVPSDEVLQSLYDQGVREINVAGQIRPLNIEG